MPTIIATIVTFAFTAGLIIVAYIPYLIALGIIIYLVYYFTQKKSD